MDTKLGIINVLDKHREGIHLRGLARQAKTSYNNTARYVGILEEEKVVIRQREANLVKIRLRAHPLTVAYLKQAHTERLLVLPKKISDAVYDFLEVLDEKPVIALIFGSYARGDYSKDSDVDLLLVFQEVRGQIEQTARRIRMRTNIRISPVYVQYSEFEKDFLDREHAFSDELRKNAIVVRGIELYYSLVWRVMG